MIANGSTQIVDLISVFTFTHFETPNNGNPCAAGGSNPCPDLVTVGLNPAASESITIDDVEYVIDFTGFQVGEESFTDFLTQEALANTATLRGTFTRKDGESVIDDFEDEFIEEEEEEEEEDDGDDGGGNEVPVPAPLFLIGLGLAAMRLARTRSH